VPSKPAKSRELKIYLPFRGKKHTFYKTTVNGCEGKKDSCFPICKYVLLYFKKQSKYPYM
jgi:hypothetical protein